MEARASYGRSHYDRQRCLLTERFRRIILNRHVGSAFAPGQVAPHFHGELPHLPGGEAAHLDEPHGIVFEKLFRRWGDGAVAARAAHGFAACFGQGIVPLGVFSQAVEVSGPVRQITHHGAVE
jgi:hypothetical protein